MDLIRQLSQGDLRTNKIVDTVIQENVTNPHFIEELVQALQNESPAVRMRAADALLKTPQANATNLDTHKKTLIETLEHSTQQEVVWHMAQIMPRLTLTEDEKDKVIRLLFIHYHTSKSNIVKVFSMQSIYDMTRGNPSYKGKVANLIEESLAHGSPAVKARARKLKKLL